MKIIRFFNMFLPCFNEKGYKVKKSLTTVILFAAAFAADAQFIAFDGFENGVPSHWELLGNGSLKLDQKHYKYAKQSLQWDFKAGDKIKIENTLGDLKRRGGYGNNCFPTFLVWIYLEKPLAGESLKFEFREQQKVVASFDFPLNFKDWQCAFIKYNPTKRQIEIARKSKKLTAMKGRVSDKVNNITISAPPKAGSLSIGLVVYNGLMYRRLGLPGFTPRKNPEPERCLDESKFPIPENISPQDLESLKMLKENYLPTFKYVKNSSPVSQRRFNKFIALLKNMSKVDKNGTYVKPIVNFPASYHVYLQYFFEGLDGFDTKKVVLYDTIHTLLRPLSVLCATNGITHEQKQQLETAIVPFFKYLMNQGFNKYIGCKAAAVYTLIGPLETIYLFRDVLRKNNICNESSRWMHCDLTVPPNKTSPNMDAFYLKRIIFSKIFIRFEDIRRQVQYVKYQSDVISKEICASGVDGFKPDGSAYHHHMHYYGYAMNALNTLGGLARNFSGSSMAFSEPALKRLKKAVMNAYFLSQNEQLPLALQGRSPISRITIRKKIPQGRGVFCAHLANVLKNYTFTGKNSFDEKLAQAYITVNPQDTAFAEKYNVKAKLPSGNLAMPYAGVVAQRRKDWLAVAYGYGKYFKGAEIYAYQNRFGIYTPNGSLDILGKDGFYASGNEENGWDWNRINGATVVYKPVAKLSPPKNRSIVPKTPHGFFGGISWRSKNGCFAMQLGFRGLKGKKTYFMINERIYALGSNIESADKEYRTQTNLYQKALFSNQRIAPRRYKMSEHKHMPTFVDSEKITVFPVEDKKLDSTSTHYLIDPQGNGYFVASDNNAFYARKTQKGRDPSDTVDLSGDFATAWLDHGIAPENAGYEYVVFPYCNKEKFAKFSTKDYDVLRKDSFAHILHDKIDGFYAGIFFAGGKVAKLPHIANVERACQIMYKDNGGKLETAVGDPDVNRRRVKHGWRESVVRPLKVTFAGEWKLESPVDGVRIISSSGDKTVIEFGCIDGKTFNFSLIK